VPTRRVWRYKPRSEPLTAFQWRFFLVEDVAGFDRLAACDGDDASQFFMLYYADYWHEVYAAHREEIEGEWRRRSWTRKQKRFVMTPYYERHITLLHDAESEKSDALWMEWSKGKRTESFEQYSDRMRAEERNGHKRS